MELSSCFCHQKSHYEQCGLGQASAAVPQPSVAPSVTNSSQGMDLDSALNELGMLSSIPDSRRQYLAERRKREMSAISRDRKVSEPVPVIKNSTGILGKSHSSPTPSSSPTKSGYQIVHINPTFVTKFCSATNANTVNVQNSPADILTQSSNSYNLKLKPTYVDSCFKNSIITNSTNQFMGGNNKEKFDLGNKFNQENVESDSRNRRTSRVRISRLKRFQKPYEMPWLQRHSIDTCYPSSSLNSSFYNPLQLSDSPFTSQSDVNVCSSGNSLYSTPEKQGLCERNSHSNTTTPERPHGQGTCDVDGKSGQFVRSKSLDELDFAKLRVAESETKSYIQERREIENVSQYLQNLNVNE